MHESAMILGSSQGPTAFYLRGVPAPSIANMAAWGTTRSDEEIWNMVAFLQKLPRLSAKQYRAVTQDGQAHHDHMEE